MSCCLHTNYIAFGKAKLIYICTILAFVVYSLNALRKTGVRCSNGDFSQYARFTVLTSGGYRMVLKVRQVLEEA